MCGVRPPGALFFSAKTRVRFQSPVCWSLQSNMADQQTSESSSSQSQSAPSSASMDSAGTAATLPTQDVVDGMSDEEELKISSWGRLFPLGTGFEKVGKCCFLKKQFKYST